MAKNKYIDVILRLKDQMSAQLGKSVSDIKKYQQIFEKSGGEFKKLGESMQKTGKVLTASITTPLVALGTKSVTNFGNVDKSMKLVESTMGDAKWATANLTSEMKKAATESVFSMQEAADASLNFARQGFNAKESAEMLKPALSLAAGTATDLSKVTSGLGNSMKVFAKDGLTAKEAADIFAVAQAQANTTTSELFNAVSVGSSIFGTVGWSLQDLATITDVFGDNAISGSEGMTAMKTGLARLVSPTDESAEWIKKLGLEITNTDGTMKDMVTVQSDLHKAFSGLTQEEQMQAASAMFGKNQMNKWLTLIRTAPTTVENYRKSLDNVSGTADKMADSLLSGVGGSIEKLKSTFDVFKYNVGEQLGDSVKKFVDKITGLLQKFNEMDPAMQKKIVKFAAFAAAIGPATIGIGKATSGFGNFLGKISTAPEKVEKIVTALSKIKNGTSKIGSSLKTLGSGIITSTKNNFAKVKTISVGLTKGLFSSIGNGLKKLGSGIITSAKNNFVKVKTISVGLAKGLFSSIGNGFKKLGSGIITIFKKLGTGILKSFKAVGKGFGTVFKFLAANPKIVIFAVIAAAVIGLVIVIIKNWDKIKPVLQKVGNWFKNLGEKIKEIYNKIKEKTVDFVANLIERVKTFVANAKAQGGVIGAVFQNISNRVKAIKQIFNGFITFIKGAFTGDWKKAWQGVKDIFAGIFSNLGAVLKAPLNGVIGLINGAIGKINSISFTVPSWVPGLGGKTFGGNLPTIPYLYKGTNFFSGGTAVIHDKGAEIVDLPRGTRVIPHDQSLKSAYNMGQRRAKGGRVNIAKLADTIIVREEADIEKIADTIARRIETLDYTDEEDAA